jgi:hypothetical protein
MLKNIDNQTIDGGEKSNPEVIKLGLDLHAKQVTECRQLDGSTPKPAQQWDPWMSRATVFRRNGAGSVAHYVVESGAWGTG